MYSGQFHQPTGARNSRPGCHKISLSHTKKRWISNHLRQKMILFNVANIEDSETAAITKIWTRAVAGPSITRPYQKVQICESICSIHCKSPSSPSLLKLLPIM
ncbi:hypothetical protein PR048_023463 [Dryococelus australis]|uniref:Uncharacterized protein n=1 Tax=Dryococelus australis TaxID=614101 RepID=A0ABQ9GU58_9NEOP|nr:hypothetical protein PR048_023463 [Dryococelus australis]